MVCFVCRNETPGCDFSLDTALDNIRRHYKLIETSMLEKGKENEELKERNNKLTKAVECLKKPTTLARLNLFSQQSEQPAPLSSPIFEDITIIDDDEEDNALISVMDTALNGSALNSTFNNEVITETEHPNWRRRALKLRSKPTENVKKSNDDSKDWNDENKKPSPKSTEDASVRKQNLALGPKETTVTANKSCIRRLSLRQSRLQVEEKRDKSSKEGTPTRTLTLGRFKKTKETNSQSDDDLFDFNKSISFQFKSPSPKKCKLHEAKTDLFPYPKTQEDASIILMPSPTQTIYFLDDTVDEERCEKRVAPKKVKPFKINYSGEESTDSLADFDMPKANDDKSKKSFPPKPHNQLTTSTHELMSSPSVKVKEETPAQKTVKMVINPIFDTAEESDDDFMVLPIQIKVEPEKKRLIDINSIDCVDCRNYIKFCGDRMTVEKLEEHIRNCVNHNNERDALRGETPEGFWNPLLVSFAEDDPRNEVLIDNRFSGKNKAASSSKNS